MKMRVAFNVSGYRSVASGGAGKQSKSSLVFIYATKLSILHHFFGVYVEGSCHSWLRELVLPRNHHFSELANWALHWSLLYLRDLCRSLGRLIFCILSCAQLEIAHLEMNFGIRLCGYCIEALSLGCSDVQLLNYELDGTMSNIHALHVQLYTDVAFPETFRVK